MASLIEEYSKEKLTGQIFTPFYIVDKILDDIKYDNPSILGKSILDPACGDGRFLIKIVERIIKFSNPKELQRNLEKVHGWDIDAEAVKLAKENLDKLLKPYKVKIHWNIEVKNTLFEKQKQSNSFDFIVGNPPYIRIQHLDIEQRTYIQNNFEFCKSGSTDIYIAFYELAIKLLHNTGKCGFITPNTFFHTETSKDLRLFFETTKNIIQITNFRHLQLFENATTYSAIFIFDKMQHKNFLFQYANTKTDFSEREISFSEITNTKFWQLSATQKLTNEGVRLADICKIHVGITTLSDKIYMLSLVKEEDNFLFLKPKNKAIVKLEKGIMKPIVKVSTLKSTQAPISEYVLFPYKLENGKNKIISEKELKNKFPLAYNYLLSVKETLDKRDNGKKNTVAWYAFGRSQGLETSFGNKIVFSTMNKYPNFMYLANPNLTFYSGYCIKYTGNVSALLKQLNSDKMQEYINVSGRDLRGGWKAYNKKIVQEFKIQI